jgi:hypothetical protein
MRLLSLITALLLFFLTACGSPTPPTEFAPDGETVSKALLLQVRHASDRLSESLKVDRPEIKIDKIDVRTLEPVYVGDLAAYHLRGEYDLILKLPRQKNTRQRNDFELYLQRQIEGKTWRLLERSADENDAETRWRSYLVQ